MFATATHMRVDSATRELASYVSKGKMDPRSQEERYDIWRYN